ncbi:hypothetical protein G5B47_24605 [Paenibacillus sp. 7124]|uniref:DUF2508 domain-containing protein n=1 Tax=Paenibacillus apii TaxID=1850370 RepID=A0A6M1PT98_9BACL|nr:DUF2508 family protein [Paenibacillus apii]NGM85584.1 hypothetical protein [Paenibacillus apii]NJJ42393.1 hypothetical protein [Paenibacillus apii]
MGWLSGWRSQNGKEQEEAQEEHWDVFTEIRKAHMEWERAHLMFDEAVGQDQIDYAIFILEAAERKYQIHLKHAKRIGLNRDRL